ncbi:hypothetical protein ACFW9F_07470 [Streptomyces sp. NPDC059506]|uniref:hypothetical protein n=1 Tax=Streptomyces sp. NPDC059506 TaxID=3347751 RepID=UPI003674F276
MQEYIALLGAMTGGFLVLMGDHIRRKVERKQTEVNRLVEASAQLSSTYNRLCGELLDAAEHGVAVTDLPSADPQRYEVATRFFMTPGSERLRSSGARLIASYTALRAGYAQGHRWDEARVEHGAAVREFEEAVRAVMRRQHI